MEAEERGPGNTTFSHLNVADCLAFPCAADGKKAVGWEWLALRLPGSVWALDKY